MAPAESPGVPGGGVPFASPPPPRPPRPRGDLARMVAPPRVTVRVRYAGAPGPRTSGNVICDARAVLVMLNVTSFPAFGPVRPGVRAVAPALLVRN